MTTKIKTTLLTTLFFFGLLSGLQAQDKYEFATVTYNWFSGKLATSINGNEFTEVKIDLPKELNSAYNSNPLLLKVNEFQDKGWEILTLDGAAMGAASVYTATLRKKKN